MIQTRSNLIWSKQDICKLDKFKVKYGFDGFDERNNFPYRNFLRFEMDCELKIKKVSRVWNSMEFDGIFFLGPQILMKFGQETSACT
jgi:hypothetical protein